MTTQMVHRATLPFGAEELEVEYGRIAKQADAAVIARVGGTVLMAAVTCSAEPLEGRDFFPLMVDYREKFYAAGRIPGSFFKRESRPGDIETLRARITDRAIRPLFPDGLRHEVMVYITILSSDNVNPAEIAALNATSMALQISSVPFPTPTGAVRVGRVDGQFILNPTIEQMAAGDIDLIVAGTRTAINMVESGATEASEDDMVAALKFAHEAIVKIIDAQEAFVKEVAKPKFEFTRPELSADLKAKVEKMARPQFTELVCAQHDKVAFSEGEASIIKTTAAAFAEEFPELVGTIKEYCEQLLSQEVRKLIIEDGKRVDGRALTQIRPITCEAPVLPITHGSALFTRGQTQALGVVTLGTVGESQMIDTMAGTWDKYFMLHYNFPPYSVGEARPMRAPGRREIGHGALAERALEPMIPAKDEFPYTIRVVSEITESNGSSSMASVCVGTLALMDAGVPMKKPVAGIAMGLVGNEKGQMAVLTDIQGVEDHLGDMDFKVAGTKDGITALQMDIKIEGITFEVMEKALGQARQARLEILEKMTALLPAPRADLAETAPRVTTIKIPVDKIGALIGPGGKNIRGICEATGAKIDVEEDGTVFISSANGEASKAAELSVRLSTATVEMGQTYEGKVVRIADFGAFLEILPGQDGMVHISELANERVETVESVCQMGDMMLVKVTNIDPSGKIRLSRKAVIREELGLPPEEESMPPRRGGGDRDRRGGGDRRGGRDRDRGDRGGRGDREDRRPSSGDKEYGFREVPRGKK